jgi:hypothetical protein
MQVTAPPRSYTITVNAAERDMMLCALRGLSERLDGEVRSAQARAGQGVNVGPFLTEARAELESVQDMTDALQFADQDVDTA